MHEKHRLYRLIVCPRCDEFIEDDAVSYVEPVEIEGFGVAHGWCAEETSLSGRPVGKNVNSKRPRPRKDPAVGENGGGGRLAN